MIRLLTDACGASEKTWGGRGPQCGWPLVWGGLVAKVAKRPCWPRWPEGQDDSEAEEMICLLTDACGALEKT